MKNLVSVSEALAKNSKGSEDKDWIQEDPISVVWDMVERRGEGVVEEAAAIAMVPFLAFLIVVVFIFLPNTPPLSLKINV